MRRTIVRFLSLILVFSFVFCTGCKEPEKKEATPTTKSEGTLIGMSFDSFVIERWTRDRDVFVSKANELGAEVNVQSAGGDVDADLAGHFKPGELSMARLNATYRQLSLGVRSQGPVHVAYGPGMVDVRGLSIDILPKGHLDLQAKMDNGALNAQGRLSRVEMAAYRKLVPALPEGGIEADFSLKGPLEAPEGGLNLKVSK